MYLLAGSDRSPSMASSDEGMASSDDGMAGSDDPKHGLAVCEDCQSVQPVEVRPAGDIRAVGNPNCRCGNNEFRLLDG